MSVVVTEDPDEIARLADAVVARHPVVHTSFGSIAGAVRRHRRAAWAAHPAGDESVLAARPDEHTPIHLTRGWSDLDGLAVAIRAVTPRPSGVAGESSAVGGVVERLGVDVASRRDERLFCLDALAVPHEVPGAARLADETDTGWLADWYTAFALEAFGSLPPGFDPAAMVERGISASRCWVWGTDDGTAVSFAVRHAAVCGVSRVGPVYTPPQHRGRGYGSAVTAEASRDILDDGDVACLFTDLANPTSNHIYEQLGYRAVTDRVAVDFG